MNAKAVRFLVLAGPVAMLAAIAGARSAGAQPALELSPDKVGTRYPRGDAEIVPAEQREALGLDDTKWTKQYGKIHPDVYKALEKAESVKEPWRDLCGFAGTVYVQAQLKCEQKGKQRSPENKAAIKLLENKVLSELTAAEFFVSYPMETLPAILGYAGRSALEKLKATPDVTAVCLDQRPFVQSAPHVTRDDLGPLKPGDPSTQPAHGRFWGSGGKAEPDVYRALALHERVFVVISMEGATAEESLAKEVGNGRAVCNRVLATLSANELWVMDRTPIRSKADPLVAGMLTAEGLRKLENRVEVFGIALDRTGTLVP